MMPPAGKYSSSDGDDDIDATFRNVTLNGDFLNGMPELSGMKLSFENAKVQGAISTARPEHAVGPNGEKIVMQESGELYYLIGEETEVPAAADYPAGAVASFDGTSSWIVDRTSYLTGLTLAEGATLTAPVASRLTMTVDGAPTPIAAGSYSGAIVLTVDAPTP